MRLTIHFAQDDLIKLQLNRRQVSFTTFEKITSTDCGKIPSCTRAKLEMQFTPLIKMQEVIFEITHLEGLIDMIAFYYHLPSTLYAKDGIRTADYPFVYSCQSLPNSKMFYNFINPQAK